MKLTTTLLLTLLLSTGLLAKDYDLAYERAPKVGDVTEISIEESGKMVTKLMNNGQVMQNQTQDSKVSLAFTQKVDEIKDDQITKMTLTFQKFIHTSAAGKKEFLKQGDIINVENNDGKVSYKKGGASLTGVALQTLQKYLSLGSTDPTENMKKAFNLTGKKKVNDAWDVNKAAFKQWMEKDGMAIKEDGIDGKFKFDSVSEVKGAEQVAIHGIVKVKNFQLKELQGLGMNFSKSEADLDVKLTKPADKKGKYQETVSNMKMQMAGSLQAFQIDVSGDLTTVEKRTILTEGK